MMRSVNSPSGATHSSRYTYWLAGMVLALFSLSLAARAASDYQWTFDASGTFSYNVTSVSSTKVYAGSLPAPNATINLILGKRYGVAVPDFASHPLEIISKGTSAGLDVVLLSQGASVGSLESDSGINYVDDGSGTIEFTVTTTLINAMTAGGNVPGYRCEFHPTTMRGNFAIFGNGTPIADPIPATIPKGTISIDLEPVVEGLAAPLGLVEPNDGTGRLFVYDQGGTITIIQNSALLPTPFLDVSNRLITMGIIQGIDIGYDERGLLGFALHPQFTTNGKVYTYTVEPVAGTADLTVSIPPGDTFDSQSVIAEWTVDSGNANVINVASRREVLRIDEPQFNHKGGKIAFGPDGFLYIALGDGGGADDQDGLTNFTNLTVGHGPDGNGQNINTALGSILRIDVNGNAAPNGQYSVPADNPFVGVTGVDEIYAYGFRNPYSFSFDSVTGNLYVGDVGQNDIEEVDIVTKGDNYGWRLKEGSFFFDPGDAATDGFVTTVPVEPLPTGLIDPIAEYDHDEGIAVIGGHVYHGSAIPDLAGRYVFGELGSFGAPTGRLFYLDATNQILEFRIGPLDQPLGMYVKGFGQDAAGEIYVLTSTDITPFGTTGKVLKIVPLAPTAAITGWMYY